MFVVQTFMSRDDALRLLTYPDGMFSRFMNILENVDSVQQERLWKQKGAIEQTEIQNRRQEPSRSTRTRTLPFISESGKVQRKEMTSRLAQQNSSQSTTQIAATPRQERVTIQEATRPPRSPPEISPTAGDNTEPLLGSIAASHEFNVHRTQETDPPRKSPVCKSDDRSRSRPLYQEKPSIIPFPITYRDPTDALI
ncbi:uncharacterized protein M437DRAFT_62023 [Aureobasidium melanogenum CBS 110374]|uniref:Uncharacterized protein n=1 Tax=Aureobasidium melanogenum (strain CBS 110374) TaxID=1043003 RepID=A0A074W3F6_AURM1|nr:uncharacterized protein M437DRAFT_62023 [Aureobasidium melanogenum CBS 110374]KEQ67635.1 hypothetical protein M437DRAFT_62023 [Aureobasidium melanogenum CBS 110374]